MPIMSRWTTSLYNTRLLQLRGSKSAHESALGRNYFRQSAIHPHQCLPTTRTLTNMVPRVFASDPDLAIQPSHVQQVSRSLEQHGILKISLEFPDTSCHYLEQLIKSLHLHHGHKLPISHSASCGWFWDVRPTSTNFQSANHQARSETMQDFPWHTDCSYESPPPRYFALQVLQHDRYGGGTLSVMSVERLSQLLHDETRKALMKPEFRIAIPTEFTKIPTQDHIHGSLLVADGTGQPNLMRFREDLLTPLTKGASEALGQLQRVLRQTEVQAQATVHLHAETLPTGSIVMIDNRRWLHARNHVKDPDRHLRRVRWDAAPFPAVVAN